MKIMVNTFYLLQVFHFPPWGELLLILGPRESAKAIDGRRVDHAHLSDGNCEWQRAFDPGHRHDPTNAASAQFQNKTRPQATYHTSCAVYSVVEVRGFWFELMGSWKWRCMVPINHLPIFIYMMPINHTERPSLPYWRNCVWSKIRKGGGGSTRLRVKGTSNLPPLLPPCNQPQSSAHG